MQLLLRAVGTRLPQWQQAGFTAYAQRLPRHCALILDEIALAPRSKGTDLDRARAQEGERLLARISPQTPVVALDERGEPWDTRALATHLATWMADGQDRAMLIGGPDGLAPACLDRASRHWSLSRLTLPHGLVRVIVAEQVYRAWSLLRNHPYHRAE